MKTITTFIIVVLFLCLLSLLLYSSDLTQEYIAESRYEASIPMSFSHKKHKQQQCVDCHHNYVDNTGRDLFCIGCHVSKVELTYMVEEQFHDLCMGCHLKKQKEGHEKYGPVRQCKACHTKDNLP